MTNVSVAKKKVIDSPDHTSLDCKKFKNIRIKFNIDNSNWFENTETTNNTINYINCVMKKKEKILGNI